VRFGKYTHLRNKDRLVQVFVNGESGMYRLAFAALVFIRVSLRMV